MTETTTETQEQPTQAIQQVAESEQQQPEPQPAEEPNQQSGGEEEFVDPIEQLAVLNDEINDGPACIKERVRVTAKQIKDGLAEVGQAVEGEPDGSTKAALIKLLDAVTFMIDEQADTVVSALAALAQGTIENVAYIRAWAEDEVQPMLDGEGGAVDDSVLFSEDANAFRQLLGQYKALMVQIGAAEPARAEQVQQAIGQIDAALKRVDDIEQTEEDEQSEGDG